MRSSVLPLRGTGVLARLPNAVQRLRSPVLVLAGQGLQSVANFLLGALLARFASVSALGDYALGATVLFLVGSLSETLVATPYTYLVMHRGNMGQRRVFAAALVATLVLTLAGGLVAAALAAVVPDLWHLVPALPAALTLGLLRELIRRRHYAHGAPLRALLSDIVMVTTQFALIGWLIALHRLDAGSAFAAIAVANAVAIVAGWPSLRHDVALAPRLLWAYARRFVRIGRWLALGGMCQIGAIQSFSWFLFLTSDARATGAFTACLAISSLPNPFLVGLTNHARPGIIRTYATQGWSRLVRQTALLGCFFVIPVLLFAAVAIGSGGRPLTLVYGQDLQWATGALTWTILALIAISLGAPLQLLMLAIHRPQAIFWLHVAELLATYAFGLPLVIALGLSGAAIGYLLTMLSGAAVLVTLFLREWRARTQHPPGLRQ